MPLRVSLGRSRSRARLAVAQSRSSLHRRLAGCAQLLLRNAAHAVGIVQLRLQICGALALSLRIDARSGGNSLSGSLRPGRHVQLRMHSGGLCCCCGGGGARCDELPGGPLDEPYAQRTFAEELTYLFPAQSNDPACDLPACNLERCCDTMRDETLGTPLQRLAAIAAAVTPTGGCVGGSYASAVAELTDVSLEGGKARVWFWQTCTAFGFYQTCDSDSACPFMRTPWLSNLSASLEDCRIAFGDDARDGVMRAIEATNEAFGGVTPAATRLLFVNGEIDPWRAASVTNSPSSGIEVLFVPGASHHAWTHPERANDSHALIAARQSIHATVTRWLAEPSAVAEPPPACVWSAGSVLNVVLAVVTALIAGAMSTLAFQTLQKRGAEVPASPPVDPAASEGAYVALPGGETAP